MYIIVEISGNEQTTTACPDKDLALFLGKAAVPISDYVAVEDKATKELLFEYGIKEGA